MTDTAWQQELPDSSAATTSPERAPSDRTHLVGLLLGAEEDWPTAFEALLALVGPSRPTTVSPTTSPASGSPSSRSTCASPCAPSS